VFRRNETGRLELIEIAPGIDIERDILAHMEFTPEISKDLKSMDARLFRPEPMGLAAIIAANKRPARSVRLERII
jgi:propionate CoA-transferase